MTPRFSKMLARGLAAFALVMTLFVSADTARANFLDDVIAAIDDAQALPFPLAPWKAAYEACVNNDDILTCMEAYNKANNNGANDKDADQVFKILSDIQSHSYSQLLVDGGTAAACAAAKLLTGLPICDILGGIYDGAKAIYDWFAGVFGGWGNSYYPTLGSTSAYACNAGQRVLPGGQCSYCPLGEALIGAHDTSKINPEDSTQLDPKYNTCGFCPGPATSVSLSPDKTCRTTSGTYHQVPNADGSGCSGSGYSNAPSCCKPGAVYSSDTGPCIPACGKGQVWDKGTKACKSCGSGAMPAYDNAGNTSAGTCVCPPFGNLTMDQNGNCVTMCPFGSVMGAGGTCVPACGAGLVFFKSSNSCEPCSKDTVPNYYNGPNSSAGECISCSMINGGVAQNGQCICPAGTLVGPGPRPQCQQCPANTYNLHPGSTVCVECQDNQFSVAGSPGCHALTCKLNQHPANHACVSNLRSLPAEQGTERTEEKTAPPTRAQGAGAARAPGGNNVVGVGVGGNADQPERQPVQNPCPPLSTWTGKVCIGPRGKHFCPETMTMENDSCVAGQGAAAAPSGAANPCPPLSRWTGQVCIGPRGKAFCPEGMNMRDGTCVR